MCSNARFKPSSRHSKSCEGNNCVYPYWTGENLLLARSPCALCLGIIVQALSEVYLSMSPGLCQRQISLCRHPQYELIFLYIPIHTGVAALIPMLLHRDGGRSASPCAAVLRQFPGCLHPLVYAGDVFLQIRAVLCLQVRQLPRTPVFLVRILLHRLEAVSCTMGYSRKLRSSFSYISFVIKIEAKSDYPLKTPCLTAFQKG